MNEENWLSLGLSLNDFKGNWELFDAHCYVIYLNDFHNDRFIWPPSGRPLTVRQRPETDGLSFTYIHLTTEGKVEDTRQTSLPRLERISWPRLILEEFKNCYPNKSSHRICWWKEFINGERRVHIALCDFSYLVVVAEHDKYDKVITAFPIEFHSQRDKKQAAYETYWKENEAAHK